MALIYASGDQSHKTKSSQITSLPVPPLVCRLYGDLTNCTYLVALKMECFWPNRLVDEFFIRVHKHYFHDCSLSGRLLRDPPNRILGPFIVVPILVTLLMTGLVVWRSKRSEGIM
ncbi:receptor activity-modifying protein 1-like [Pleuronectes platessa]|uniref:receptor activity-modifying protein 1-like n=1 Tax=Pleuronectes platessa TaxID=8262 RepID=UPI00232A0A47|nr:receptor activity-modifying protein 1-like [Pleuronectes platessa]